MPLIGNTRWPAAALALALAACGGKGSDPGSPQAGECSVCHGSASGSAPPTSTKGTTATTDVRVGAHQAHLGPGLLRKPIDCDECHVVPESVDSPGHADKDRADVVFPDRGLARTRGATPSWNGTSCAGTYCHGATLAGGTDPQPVWTRVDGDQVGCGSCHGAPPAQAGSPPVAHPAVSGPVPATCASCHPGTVRPDGTIDVDGGQHLDGVVEIAGVACAGCHGDPARVPGSIAAAPPADTHGGTGTTLVGVGAHQKHLAGTALSARPVACAECHDVPDGMSHHPDGTVDVSFGPLARAGGVVPAWNRAAATCVTYCHGASLRGGGATAPVWTKVDGTQVRCTSCHGDPPPAPHVQDAQCGTCHLGYGAATVNGALHLDGYVEVGLKTCFSCHGSESRSPELQPAPPIALSGATDPSALGVGAHEEHLGGTALSRPIACTECHPRVTSTDHAVGMNNERQMAFGPLASAGGTFPVWDRAAATCASTYCHGGTLSGGQATAPVWTRVDGSQERCDSCHGNPPPPPHPPRPDCSSCHAGTTQTTVVAATHVDGVVNVSSLRCTTCHGDATRLPAVAAAAPPFDTAGRFSTGLRSVGAHQRHLVDGALRTAVPCAECHVVPTVMNHADATAAVTFGPLAVTDSTAARWDGTRCSGVYCHGATLGGGSNKAPAWATVDGTQAACGTCHGLPPPAPHPPSDDCAGCHAGYTVSSVDPSTHVDGVVQASTGCTSCHGDPAADPAYAAAPPKDTQGNTLTTAPGVGAHRLHLATALRVGAACTDCHPATNASTHPENAAPAVAFGPLARSGAANPAWNAGTLSCASVYCHGSTLAGGTDLAPAWTGPSFGSTACTACHGIPPTSPAHAGMTAATDCAPCHPGYTAATVDPATHVDGVIDAVGGSCTSCHGDGSRSGPGAAAPPEDVSGHTATSARGVGAHQRHLDGGSLRAGMACTECHPTPGTPHPSGSVELVFGALARTGTTPAWNGTALTCASTYCHGATLAGGTLETPLWTKVDGTQAACGTCHGVPPPKPHVQRTACGACHPGTTATSVSLATHVDGTVQTVALGCTTCHGDPARTLVAGADAQARAAPPTDTTGASAATLRSVGAHLAHLNRGTGAIASPTKCSECHVVPSSSLHANGTVAVTFGTLARTGGVSPSWNGTTCANSYCHGNHTYGLNATPSWTATGPLSCSTGCHPHAPGDSNHTTLRHPAKSGACNGCHKDTDAAGSAIVSPALHVNGRVDGLCTDCHH